MLLQLCRSRLFSQQRWTGILQCWLYKSTVQVCSFNGPGYIDAIQKVVVLHRQTYKLQAKSEKFLPKVWIITDVSSRSPSFRANEGQNVLNVTFFKIRHLNKVMWIWDEHCNYLLLSVVLTVYILLTSCIFRLGAGNALQLALGT